MNGWKLPVFSIVVVLAVSVSCSKETQPGISVDEAFVPLVRSDTTLLAGVDLEKLKAAPLYQKVNGQLNLSFLDQFSEQFGVDPRRDLKRVLYVAEGKKSYFLAQGAFDGDAVKGKIHTLGLRTTRYKGIDVMGTGKNSFALLKGPVALLGAAADVRSAIDTKDDGGGSVPAEIVDRLRALAKDHQIFVVSRDGLPFLSSAVRTDVRSALSNIVGYVAVAAGSLGVDKDVHVQATLACFSIEGAARVNDALRGTVAIGRLSTKDGEASLLKIYDSIQITRTDNTVQVQAHLTEKQADELIHRFVKR